MKKKFNSMVKNLKQQSTINIIGAIGLPIIILLLGIMTNTLLTNNKQMYEMNQLNNKQHYEIMLKINEMNNNIHNFYDYEYIPTDSLAHINSKRLDIQSEWGYAQANRLDSVDENHEKRLVIIEKKIR